MSTKLDLKKLAEPFAPEDIEWRLQRSGTKNGKQWGMALAYVTSRAIQQRLDDVVGPERWRNEFQAGPGGGVVCGISIQCNEESAEWVTKWDGADNTNIEAVKGGLSDAMKRAAVHWGIGRYLYKLEAAFVEITAVKGQHYVKDQNVSGYWNDPALPAWALPKAKTAPVATPVTPKPKAAPTPEPPEEPLPSLDGVDISEIPF